MKVVIDSNIPFIEEAARALFSQVIFAKGSEISPSMVKDADALIVRTRTFCNADLLENSSVKFIATATIGYDHLDTPYLEQKGIKWCNQPGCNAESVAQYIESCIILLEQTNEIEKKSTIGLVGAGHVGQAVEKRLRSRGYNILICDPPRQKVENADFYSLDELCEKADLISFHVPLTLNGEYATRHMASTRFFNKLKKGCIIINAARGGVIDEEALLMAQKSGIVSRCIIDTWENEPDINQQLLHEAWIATPHIAGYSADGKANATRMALNAICKYFQIEQPFDIAPPELPERPKSFRSEDNRKLWLYNPLHDSEALKKEPHLFEKLRSNYPLRREL